MRGHVCARTRPHRRPRPSPPCEGRRARPAPPRSLSCRTATTSGAPPRRLGKLRQAVAGTAGATRRDDELRNAVIERREDRPSATSSNGRRAGGEAWGGGFSAPTRWAGLVRSDASRCTSTTTHAEGGSARSSRKTDARHDLLHSISILPFHLSIPSCFPPFLSPFHFQIPDSLHLSIPLPRPPFRSLPFFLQHLPSPQPRATILSLSPSICSFQLPSTIFTTISSWVPAIARVGQQKLFRVGPLRPCSGEMETAPPSRLPDALGRRAAAPLSRRPRPVHHRRRGHGQAHFRVRLALAATARATPTAPSPAQVPYKARRPRPRASDLCDAQRHLTTAAWDISTGRARLEVRRPRRVRDFPGAAVPAAKTSGAATRVGWTGVDGPGSRRRVPLRTRPRRARRTRQILSPVPPARSTSAGVRRVWRRHHAPAPTGAKTATITAAVPSVTGVHRRRLRRTVDNQMGVP